MSSFFKALDINGYWRYGDFFSDSEAQRNIIRTHNLYEDAENQGEWHHTDHETRPNTECLFSTMEDKNGIEIYENDILYYDFANADMEEFFYRVVKFQYGKFVGMFMTGSSIPKVNELDLFKCLENGYIFKGNIFDSGNEVLK